MPTNYIKKLSEDLNIPVATLEDTWERAKEIIGKKTNEEDPKYWPFVTTVFNNMMGIATAAEFPEWWVKLGPKGQERYLKTRESSKLKKTYDKRGRLLKGVTIKKGSKTKAPSTPKGPSTPSDKPSKPKAEDVHEDDADLDVPQDDEILDDTTPEQETTPEQKVEDEVHEAAKPEPKVELKPIVKQDRPPRSFYEKAKVALKVHKKNLKRGLSTFTAKHKDGAKAIGKMAMGLKLSDEEKEHATKTTSMLVTGLLGAAVLGAMAFAGPGLSTILADKFINRLQNKSESSGNQRDPIHKYVDDLTTWLESVDLAQVAEEAAKANQEEIKNDRNA